MNCVAQATPMVTVGFGLLRRRALAAWVRTTVARWRRPATADDPGGDRVLTPR